MRTTPTADESPMAPVAEHIREISDGVTRLIKEHVELAKLEMSTSVKKAARDGALTGVGGYLGAVGYLLFMMAIGFWIGGSLGMGRGFLIVAAFNVALGGLLAGTFAGRLAKQDKPGLAKTTHELRRDRRFLRRAGQMLRAGP